jgi:hypothetical protein
MKILFSNLKSEYWKNLILAAIFSFYLAQYGFMVVRGRFPMDYGSDFLAYWSAGKIAFIKGYSEIYDLNYLWETQVKELKDLGIVLFDDSVFQPFPAPFFSFFILPFQLLSQLHSDYSYWIWTLINLAALFWYLSFFIQNVSPGELDSSSRKKLLFLVLSSFPVFINLIEGQSNVFLMICAGEIIRGVGKEKLFFSGLWLGGFILKPQLLVLIIPILVITGNWRVLLGFLVSSGVVLIFSFSLSGYIGMESLVNLWLRYRLGISTSSPGAMINWRMIGENLNVLFNTSSGWMITWFGIALTMLGIYLMVKKKFLQSNSYRFMGMLGVISATFAVTWHAHYHMALILVPLLIYVSVKQLISENIIYAWVWMTPVVWFGVWIVFLFILLFVRINLFGFQAIIIAFSGFLANLALLILTMRFFYHNNLIKK